MKNTAVVLLVVFLALLEQNNVHGRRLRCVDESTRKRCSAHCRTEGYGFGVCDYGECSCYGDINEVGPKVTEAPTPSQIPDEFVLTRINVRCTARSHPIFCPYQCFRLGFSGGMCDNKFCHCTPNFASTR